MSRSTIGACEHNYREMKPLLRILDSLLYLLSSCCSTFAPNDDNVSVSTFNKHVPTNPLGGYSLTKVPYHIIN